MDQPAASRAAAAAASSSSSRAAAAHVGSTSKHRCDITTPSDKAWEKAGSDGKSTITAGETPTIKLGNGEPYREGALWKDIYQAMLNAKHFIYVAGALPFAPPIPQTCSCCAKP